MQNMQKKLFPIFSIVLLLISLVAPGIQPVGAEEKEDVVYEDGEYDIIAKALNANSDEESGAAGFINEKAKIIVKDKEIKLAITVPHNDMAEIKGLQVEGIEPIKDEQDGSTIYTYKLNELKEMLNARTQYVVPMMGIDHDVPLRFNLEGLEDIPVVEETPEVDNGAGDGDDGDNDAGDGDVGDNDAGDGDVGDNDAGDGDESDGDNDAEDGDESEGDKDAGDGNESGDDKVDGEDEGSKEDSGKDFSLDNLDDGYYTLSVDYLRDDNDETSSMGRYLSEEVFVAVKDGKVELTVTIEDDETVTKLEVSDQTAIEKTIDGEKRYETFDLEKLESILNAYVEYQAPYQGSVFEGSADFRIAFVEDSIQEAKASDKPGSEELSLDNLANGYYTIDVDYLRSDNDDTSSMGRYLSDEVFVAVKDGKVELTVTVEDDETVTKLEVSDQTAIEKTIDGEKRYETFDLEKLESILNAYVEYQAPYQGSVFEGSADFRVAFVEDSIQEAKSSDKPEGEELSLDTLTNGYYTIGVDYLRSDNDETSSMGRYLSDEVFVAVKDGKVELTVTVEDDETVTKLEVSDQTAIEKAIDGEKRYETFELAKLESILKAYVEYQAPYAGSVFEGSADFRIAFEEGSIKKAKLFDKPTGEVIEEEKPETPEEPEEEPEDPKEEVKPVEGFNLGFTFYEKGKDNPSIMDGFKKGPAKIKVDTEGNYVVSMKFTSGEMIKSLKVNQQNAKVVKESNGTKVFEFKLKDLTKKHSAEAVVNVPGVYENKKHEVDLVFDDKDMIVRSVKDGEEVQVRGNDRLDVKGSKVSILMPPSLPAETDFKIDLLEKDSTVPKGYKIAGDIIDVTTDFKGKLEKDEYFTITLGYNQDKYNKDEVDIYYYNEKKSKWEPKKATNNGDGTLTLKVKHFSKYGVLAKEDEVEKAGKKQSKKKSGEQEKVSDYNYQKMNYTFYKSGTMEKSIMDDFSKGEAIVRTHKNSGKQYATLTFSSPEMIKYIKVDGIKAQVIEQNKDEMVVDFPVKNLKEKQSVIARIEVPGMYDTEHTVDLVFDTQSATDISLDDLPSYLKKHIEDPETPSRTNGGDGNGSGGTPTPDPVPDFDRDADGNIIGSNGDSGSGINPKTADLNMTQIMLFGSLLLLSLIPLVIKLRRRFVMEE